MSAGVTLRPARPDELQAVTALINAAFAVEHFFKPGDRTSAEAVRQLFEKGAMLIAEAEAALVGSVYVEVRGERAYIGMLAVAPNHQGHGIARALMTAAEDLGRSRGCVVIDVTVVNLRTELPPLYRKFGYVESGTEPFLRDTPTTLPCHFIRMSKTLGGPKVRLKPDTTAL